MEDVILLRTSKHAFVYEFVQNGDDRQQLYAVVSHDSVVYLPGRRRTIQLPNGAQNFGFQVAEYLGQPLR